MRTSPTSRSPLSTRSAMRTEVPSFSTSSTPGYSTRNSRTMRCSTPLVVEPTKPTFRAPPVPEEAARAAASNWAL
ncbi:Uncharacterised protein [Bordetella pertussis]|nr:Uncharacterised protein [Bordetella pertussis]